MNRRTFATCLFSSVTLGSLASSQLHHADAQPTSRSVTTTWNADFGSSNEIDRFATTITVHETEDTASDAFDGLLDDVQEGTLYNEESGSETIGDDSFFVRYSDPNFVVDEMVIRFGPLIYQFRSEAVHFGGARDAYRLMEDVFKRVDESATTEDELNALLPTAEEVAPYGLTEEVKAEATPTA